MAIPALTAAIAKPVYDAAGRFVGGTIRALENKIGHQNEDGAKTICGIDFVIRELALDAIAHRLRLTVLWSPNDRMNGISFENNGKSAQDARNKILNCFKVVVKNYYRDLSGFTG